MQWRRAAARRSGTRSGWPCNCRPSESPTAAGPWPRRARTRCPSFVLPKTRPPAVAITPAQSGECSRCSHRRSPVRASSARTAPYASPGASTTSPPPMNGLPGSYVALVLKYREPISRTGTKSNWRRASKAGLNQLVAPCRLGHTSVPVSEGSMPGMTIGPAARIESARPCLFRVRRAAQELARCPIEDVVEPVAIRRDDQLAWPPVHGGVDEHGDLIRVPVVGVVRRELEVPAELRLLRRPAQPASSCTGCRPGDCRRSSRARDCRRQSRAGSAPESKEPVTHVGAPPVFQLSPPHVSCPGSPGPGTV